MKVLFVNADDGFVHKASANAALYLMLILVVGTKQIMEQYQRYQPTIVRLSGMLILGFGIHALTRFVPSLLGFRNN